MSSDPILQESETAFAAMREADLRRARERMRTAPHALTAYDRDVLGDEYLTFVRERAAAQVATATTEAERLAAVISTAIKLAIAPRDEKIAALEEQVADLRAKPQVRYCGVWRDDATYGVGDAVTKAGSLWICRLNSVRSEPGSDAGVGWQLAVKRGKDGKDLR